MQSVADDRLEVVQAVRGGPVGGACRPYEALTVLCAHCGGDAVSGTGSDGIGASAGAGGSEAIGANAKGHVAPEPRSSGARGAVGLSRGRTGPCPLQKTTSMAPVGDFAGM
jgi:hypothetical protein